jgi:hypothetical protein
MKIQTDEGKVERDGKGFWIAFHIRIPLLARKIIESIQKGKIYDIEIKLHRDKRSNDANSYMWKLCDEIAIATRDITRIDVYRDAVKQAGKFDFILCKPEAVETFVHNWQSRGIGWIAEKTDVSTSGFQQIVCYYGSSVYDTKEMSVLLDFIVNEAQDLDIETRTPDEIAKMEAEYAQADQSMQHT